MIQFNQISQNKNMEELFQISLSFGNYKYYFINIFRPIKTTLNTTDILRIDEHTFRYTEQLRKDSNENYLTLLNNEYTLLTLVIKIVKVIIILFTIIKAKECLKIFLIMINLKILKPIFVGVNQVVLFSDSHYKIIIYIKYKL